MNIYDEGYVKYHCDWQQAPPLADSKIDLLNQYRQQMYDLGLIGFYPDLKVGYGNISQRYAQQDERFIISGTQTGHLTTLDARHYTLVNEYDIAQNTLVCEGPIKASSESLTHAAVYGLANQKYQAVIHIHSLELWQKWMYQVPTSSANVPYGTPEMAYEIQRLYATSDLPEKRILVMAGHHEGIISFGETLEEATQVLRG